MSVRTNGVALLVVLAMGSGSAPSAHAQERVLDRVHEQVGWTAFETAIREGVQICDWGFHQGRSRDYDRDPRCTEGVVTVLLRSDGRRIIDVKHRSPDSARGPAAEAHLGAVSTREVADYLLELVPDAPEDVAEDALGVAAMVDSVRIWPHLERFATDRQLATDVREAALFWLGQAAAEEATRGITAVLDTPDEEIEVKEAAVFALSQRPEDVAVPLLLDVARGRSHPEVRENAFFWLSQFDDPRVLRFFREVLRGG